MRLNGLDAAKLEDTLERVKSLIKNRAGLGRLLLSRPFNYFGTFLSDSGVAAIHPSSRYLVGRVARAAEESSPRVIVEFGAAEGVMTKRILQSLPQNGTLVAIERNADFYENLTKLRDGRLRTMRGDARDVRMILGGMGIAKADCFISGIPFSFLPLPDRATLVREVHDHLSPGGRFVAYQCTSHLMPLLRRQFAEVKVELEVRNMPPHFVFTAIKSGK